MQGVLASVLPAQGSDEQCQLTPVSIGILKQRVLDRLWRFLKNPDIPPTNNDLRTVLMVGKVSQRSKNAMGARVYMRIKATGETAQLRGQDPVAVLTVLMR